MPFYNKKICYKMASNISSSAPLSISATTFSHNGGKPLVITLNNNYTLTVADIATGLTNGKGLVIQNNGGHTVNFPESIELTALLEAVQEADLETGDLFILPVADVNDSTIFEVGGDGFQTFYSVNVVTGGAYDNCSAIRILFDEGVFSFFLIGHANIIEI